jgi:DNA-binding transcriptional MocR family regulator
MENTIAFIRGIPPVESFPKEKLVECARAAILNHGDQILQYAGAAGYDPLRQWIADRHQAVLDGVILGQGSLQLLDFYIHSCLKPGDKVYVEQPTYDRTLTLFKRAGMQIKGFDLIKGVINPLEVEQSLNSGVIPKAFYVIPDFQNPSGALMPLEQRQKLLELAKQYDFLIIEDGPYRHLRYSGEHLPTLYELDPSHVLHMSSFSKIISPGLRVGYMVGRDNIVSSIRQYAEDTCINSSHLNQAVVYEFIQNGWLDRHVESLISLYRKRLNAMLDSLETFIGIKGKWLEPQGGFFAGLTLDRNVNIPDTQTCKSVGIALSNSQGFFLDGGENYLRLPFCALTPDEIRTGIQRLSSLL